ncbi:hypothetical protein CWI39_0126p0040 [Hamiltosporidium magnivora]|uniref:Uncharacterized protein n=1 Tax=Hamiltosporidium magnivora TaxID=148818 RepID=A0A4Q9LKW4_9MICR|nr:hypothetical protein CWI39_0126p0040 [Hamiltosporidium magnivora]
MNVAHNLSIVLKKTFETISFDRRKRLERERQWCYYEIRDARGTNTIAKQARNQEDSVKYVKTKNITPIISQRGTTLGEPIININEESDLKEEKMVIVEVEENL